jgi:hypothetical protein
VEWRRSRSQKRTLWIYHRLILPLQQMSEVQHIQGGVVHQETAKKPVIVVGDEALVHEPRDCECSSAGLVVVRLLAEGYVNVLLPDIC